MNLTFGKRGRLPMVLQAENAECGLCCVAMIASYYGYHTDLVSLRRKVGLSNQGATLRSIMDVADSVQLSHRPLRVELEEIDQIKLPAIVHWNFDHFVVLKKVGRNKVTIHDPAVGIRSYSKAEFSNHFTGIALELTPRNEFTSGDESEPLSIWEFWKGTRGLGSSIFQVLLLSLLIQVFSLATPFYMQIVVDDVLIKHDGDLLQVLALGFLALTLISVATKAIRGFTSLYLVNQLTYNIGNSVLHHLIRLPMAYFETRHMGDVVSRFGSISPIQDFITGGVVSVAIDGLLALTTLALMFLYSPTLATVVCVSTALYAVFRSLQFRPLRDANHENIAANAKLDSIFMETIRALQGVKLANKEVDRQNTWRNQFAESINSNARIGRLSISYETANNILTGCEYVLVIYLGAQSVLDGGLTVGMLYAFMAYRTNFSSAAISIINLFIQYRMIGLHLERVGDITQTKREPGIDAGSHLLLPIDGHLEVKDLGFRYSPSDPYVFQNFNAQIPSGSFVAIFGPSGTGKTTLMKAMMGLVEPTDGHILVDGMQLEALGNRSFRHHLSAVMQNDTLFSGSLKENIAFFDLIASPEKINASCETACILQDINTMHMGLDSLIGDMGSSLSVGQQQRVLLARALYRDPKMLFLDEGTAHLDGPTELQVFNNLKQLDITCIFVTHNPALLEFADYIVHWAEPKVPAMQPKAELIPNAPAVD